MISVLGYSCSTAAGSTPERFWHALTTGHDCRDKSTARPGCFWQERQESQLDTLVYHLSVAYSGLKLSLESAGKDVLKGDRLGVIMASTKGAIEDFIWRDTVGQSDFISPVLNRFIADVKLRPARIAVVSNACASSHGAVFLASRWFESKAVDHVLIVAADGVGPFVWQGFNSLGILAKETCRPFAGDRDGLQLGEAAAALLLSRTIPADLVIEGIAINSEGSAVTRPAKTGESLRKACVGALNPNVGAPQLIIAHGTGTKLNDQTEDQVFSQLFGRHQTPVLTGVKWCTGHTLGASGAVDLIAAALALKHNTSFPLTNSIEKDPTMADRVALSSTSIHQGGIERVLITSLGFGGANAAAVLARAR